MSVKVMSWVLEHSRASAGDLLVLLILADHADDETWSCWPGIARLAALARMSERGVQYCLRNLEGLGELEVTPPGDHKTNTYRIRLEQYETLPFVSSRLPAEDSGVQSLHPVKPSSPGGEAQFTRGVKPSSPEPSLNRHIEPSDSLLPPTEYQIDLNLNPIPFLEQTCRRHGIKHIKLDKFGRDLLNEADRAGPFRPAFRGALVEAVESRAGDTWESVWPAVKSMVLGVRGFKATATARGPTALAQRRLERRYEEVVRQPERPRRKSQDELTKELIDADDDPVWND